MTIWRMRIACWVPKATDTQSEYAIFIDFPLRQYFREYTSVLRYVTSTLCVLFNNCVVQKVDVYKQMNEMI